MWYMCNFTSVQWYKNNKQQQHIDANNKLTWATERKYGRVWKIRDFIENYPKKIEKIITTTKKDIKFVCKSAWTTIVNKINSKSVEKEAVCVDGVYWNSNNRSIHHGPSNPKRVGVLEIDQKNTHKNKWIEMSTGFIQFASLRNLLERGNEFYSRIAWTIFKLTLVSHGFSIRL